MNIRNSAKKLVKELRKKYTNIKSVGICESNSWMYKDHPEWFSYEIKEDSLVVYIIEKASSEQLELKRYNGFKVEWKVIGDVVIKGGK